jgi:hypothetical protein
VDALNQNPYTKRPTRFYIVFISGKPTFSFKVLSLDVLYVSPARAPVGGKEVRKGAAVDVDRWWAGRRARAERLDQRSVGCDPLHSLASKLSRNTLKLLPQTYKL